MHIMESVIARHCEDLFPHANRTGECSYFRIRDLASGTILANVSGSIDFNFCSALADHDRDALWVFCSAFGRYNKANPGPCSHGYDNCYVGTWKTKLSGDFSSWTPTARSVTLPAGVGMANNDVTLVSGKHAAARAAEAGLPPYQAVMILETDRGNWSNHTYPEFAINTGSDGDLSKNWVVLPKLQYRISGGPAGLHTGEGTGDAPTIRYDAEEGYFYSIGGGWITNGPARSANLTATSWEGSPLAPIAVPALRAAKAGLPATDMLAGINTKLYTNIWRNGIPENTKLFVANMTKWNWGVTDPDVCCSDGKSPSYMLHTLSHQGGPLPPGTKSLNMAAMNTIDMPLFEWFRSYFP